MTGNEFYEEACKRENWPEWDLCDPPTDPRVAVHVLIDHFLGENWYVTMPENDDQCITAAVAVILDEYPRSLKDRLKRRKKYVSIGLYITIVNMLGVLFHLFCR